MSNNLDSFVTSNKERPTPIATSQEIRDRGSTFVGTIYPARSLKEAESCISYLRDVVHYGKKASHEIAAFRYMALRDGASGLGGPDDFELKAHNWDDGEMYGSARILNAMAANGVMDAVVIVSRWYGGTMLGPARFDHITTCASEVCVAFRKDEELKECKASLESLDAVLAGLREQLAGYTKTDQTSSPGRSTTSKAKKTDYSELDLVKGRRLIRARENAIAATKKALAKHT